MVGKERITCRAGTSASHHVHDTCVGAWAVGGGARCGASSFWPSVRLGLARVSGSTCILFDSLWRSQHGCGAAHGSKHRCRAVPAVAPDSNAVTSASHSSHQHLPKGLVRGTKSSQKGTLEATAAGHNAAGSRLHSPGCDNCCATRQLPRLHRRCGLRSRPCCQPHACMACLRAPEMQVVAAAAAATRCARPPSGCVRRNLSHPPWTTAARRTRAPRIRMAAAIGVPHTLSTACTQDGGHCRGLLATAACAVCGSLR
jgi:hypothetical protein